MSDSSPEYIEGIISWLKRTLNGVRIDQEDSVLLLNDGRAVIKYYHQEKSGTADQKLVWWVYELAYGKYRNIPTKFIFLESFNDDLNFERTIKYIKAAIIHTKVKIKLHTSVLTLKEDLLSSYIV
jgi:hypothetical protein